jgi:hypothetical protein
MKTSCCILSVLALGSTASAQCESWAPVGGGLTRVTALATYDDGSGPVLYAGGWFADPAGGTPNHVARWDGTAWDYFGGGVIEYSLVAGGTAFATVEALEVFDDGSGPALYAGGFFDLVNGAPATNVARWDGTSWTPVLFTGVGSFAWLSGFAVFNDGSGPALYAAGGGGHVWQQGVSRVHRWDGAQWSLAGMFPIYPSGFMDSLVGIEVFDDGSGPALYALSARTLVHRWDGSTNDWTAITGVLASTQANFVPDPTTIGHGYHLATHNDGSGPALYFAGRFAGFSDGSTTIAARNVVRYDGTNWSGLGAGVGAPASFDYVGELFSYNDGSGPKLAAGGVFGTAGGAPAENLAVWDGAAWMSLGGGMNEALFSDPYVDAFAYYDDGSGSALYAGGWFSRAGGLATKGIARWTVVPASSNYCTGGTTALGCTPAISASGGASASAVSGFQVSVTGLEGRRNGVVVFGTSGADAAAWGAGSSYQCVRAPLLRTGLQNSGGTAGTCNGSMGLDFNTWMSANAGLAPGVGQTVWMQGWFRDPGATPTSSLSDALMFPVCP